MLEHDHWDNELVSQVHPPSWVNPKPAANYDLVVIGSGTGGLVSAAGAAGLGARVAIIERHLMGGDCLNVGCVPSKGLISAARSWHTAKRAAPEYAGPTLAEGSAGDFEVMMNRMRRIRSELSPIDGAPRFRDMGIDVFLGDGAFLNPSAITVNFLVISPSPSILMRLTGPDAKPAASIAVTSTTAPSSKIFNESTLTGI